MRNIAKLAVGVSAVMLAAGNVSAQHIESLVKASDDWGFFVQPELKTTRISSHSAQIIGLRMGPALERTLHISLAGYALVSSVDPDNSQYKDLNAFDLWYAGLSIDYTFFPNKLAHAGIGCLLGAGQLRAATYQDSHDTANLFIAEPQANLLFNLTETLELGFGLSYRFVNGSDLSNLDNTDLSDVAGSVFLRWTEAP